MTAGDPLRVEPQVVLRGDPVRESVILPAVPAHQYDKPCKMEQTLLGAYFNQIT